VPITADYRRLPPITADYRRLPPMVSLASSSCWPVAAMDRACGRADRRDLDTSASGNPLRPPPRPCQRCSDCIEQKRRRISLKTLGTPWGTYTVANETTQHRPRFLQAAIERGAEPRTVERWLEELRPTSIDFCFVPESDFSHNAARD
jgi:hypothetical protein